MRNPSDHFSQGRKALLGNQCELCCLQLTDNHNGTGVFCKPCTTDISCFDKTPKSIEVLNKVDILEPDARSAVAERARRNVAVVPLSAITGEGCDAFLDSLETELAQGSQILELVLDGAEGAALAWLHEHGNVVDQKFGDGGQMKLSVILDKADEARFQSRFGESIAGHG